MKRGFTLPELLMVLSIVVIIMSFTYPVGVRHIHRQELDETTSTLEHALRRVQYQALFQKNQSSHGIKILPSQYVLFEGVSYGERDAEKDEVVALSEGISMSGIDEIVFFQKTGSVSTSGVMTISRDAVQRTISISPVGVIEKE